MPVTAMRARRWNSRCTPIYICADIGRREPRRMLSFRAWTLILKPANSVCAKTLDDFILDLWVEVHAVYVYRHL